MEKTMIGVPLLFTAGILTPDERLMDPRTVHPAHELFLRPVLKQASDCWVYGLVQDTEVYNVVSDIITSEKGKHRVSLLNEPITGREVFWNATGAERGTIVLAIPVATFDPSISLKACKYFAYTDNVRAGHTPAAVNFAKKMAASAPYIVLCFPRNNGMEWIDIFAPPTLVEKYFR
jgi:hypothetical protein